MVKPDLVVQLVEIGPNLAVLLPRLQARRNSLLAGSNVRVIMLNGEIRIRPVTAPRAYDHESLDDYRDRVAKEESECLDRWDHD
jgi:hypothetical protein